MRTGNFIWRVNQQIQATEVRAVDEDGKQLGLMNLSEAIAKARELGIDVIEIAPLAKPPVVKIIEIGKFKYEQEKKERLEKRKVKGGELKEVRFSPFMAENDFKTRLARVREFLEESNKVRLVVKFTGRQMGQKSFGYEIIAKVKRSFGDSIVEDMEPKFLGRHLVGVISPIKKKMAKATKESENVKTKDA